MLKPISEITLQQLLGVAMILLLVYFLPYFVLGTDAPILIHDNLDSNLVWVKLVLENGGIFSSPDTHIPQILGGVPRSSVFGTYDISLLWFQVFGMYWGYVANKVIMGGVAFWGMFGLLYHFVSPKGISKYIIVGVALIYSCLPFWSFTLSVAGMPAVMWAFLNLRKPNYSKFNWVVIGIIPWYSSLVLSGFFIAILLGLIWVYDILRTKKINGLYFSGMVLFGVMYILSHIPLFYTFVIQSSVLSHRVEMKWIMGDWDASRGLILSIFQEGQYHAHSLHELMIYPILWVSIISIALKKHVKLLISVFLFLIFTSILYGLLRYEGLAIVVENLMAVIPIQLQRFHFLHPMFWYLLFGLGLVAISEKWIWGKYLAMALILFQLGNVAMFHEVFSQETNPTFKQFFATDQFNEIKNAMGASFKENKVISVGLHPSISQFNGLYTLDGYLPSYPLAYKYQFRKVISGELDKNPGLEKYFDEWGSRCYSFSSELGKDFMNPNPSPIENLDYDLAAFKALKGKYLISTAKIKNNPQLDLILDSAKNPGYWNLYLYQIK